LIDRVGATAENVTDVGVGQFFPHGQPQKFLVLGSQAGKSVEDFLVLSASHNNDFGTWCRLCT
jgi:hypothetical protein